jgi:hypothetical protein
LIGLGFRPFPLEAGMLGVEIRDGEGDMAVGLPMGIGFGPAVIDGQFHLEIGFRIAQIDQGEAVEIEAVGGL